MRHTESLEGGINRNSSPQAIAAMREVYNRFLGKFPLFFGYWKKFADFEFAITGPEAADLVHCLSTTNGLRSLTLRPGL